MTNDGSRVQALVDSFEEYSSRELRMIIVGATVQLAQRDGVFSAMADVDYLLEPLEPRSGRKRH